MNRLRRHINPGSLMFRVVVLNCSLLLLVTLMITATGNIVYQSALEEHARNTTMETQEQVIKSLDLIFQALANDMELLGTAPPVQGYLSVDESNEQERVRFESEARALMLRTSEAIPAYLNIVLASERGQYISNDTYRIKKVPLSEDDWYREAIKAEGNIAVMHTSLGRNLKTWHGYSTNEYLSVSKMVTDVGTGEVLGVILVDLDINAIQNLVDDISMGQTGFGYIQDNQGQVVYAPQNDVVYRMNPDWFVSQAASGQFQCMVNGASYNVIYTCSEYTDLRAVGVYDREKTIESAARVRRNSILAAAIVMLVAVIASIIYAASITRPISELSRLMERAQTGDLSVHFNNVYHGEISTLGDAFNSMVARLNKQVAMIYHEQKNKREAELKIMHEQIKPHFLYNTLDTIQWMAKDDQPGEIVKIVLALSNFFRTSLSQGKELITLRQEVEMVRNYLEIQKYRYEDLFDYQMDFAEDILDRMVLKLSLQPLVENALYHGIKESDMDHGTIWIRGFVQDGELILEVEDDGIGMTKERCEQLNSWMDPASRPADADAFGSINVNDRVRILCDDGFGLSYKLREGGGTIATLRIGYLKMGEKYVEGADSR